jgi:branched-chain amino acid transport system substrate-binding protein
MKKRSIIFILIIFVLLLTSCKPGQSKETTQACEDDAFGCAEFAAGDNIKLGYGAPMTGDYAAFGIDISQGAQIALDDFGDLEGWAFELVVEDDQGAPEGGAAVANKLAADAGVVAIVGHVFSGATAAAIPIYDEIGIPMMSPSATNPDLTAMGTAVFNRNAFTDIAQASAAADYMYNNLSVMTLAVMHDGGDYGQGLAQMVSDNFESLGGEIVAFEAITPGEADYSAPLSAVAANSPDALYFGGYNADAAVMVNQMTQAGLDGVTFFGCDGTFGQDFLEKTGENGEGAYSTTLVPASSAEKDAFDAAYEAAYGDMPGVLSAYTWNGYDSAAVLLNVIKSVAIVDGDTLYIPRGALVNAVRTVKDYQGLAGTITCAADGECNATGPVLYIIQDGAWTSVQ